MKNSCKMELSRNHVQGEINMLYSYITKNLIGLQDVILRKVEQNETSIYIYLQMPRKAHTCPCCGKSTDKVHDYRKQYIKDIPAFGKLTYIVLNKRRYVCPSCKKRFYETVDFVPRKHQSTKRLAIYAIDKLSDERSFSSVARETNLSVSTVIRRFDMVAFIQPKTLPEVLAIDEFKGNTGKEKYQCILTNPQTGEVLDILPERYSSYLNKYMRKYTREERKQVKYFISDMWNPYTNMATTYLPEAMQIIDKYHFIRQIIWAFERVRKSEQKKYGKENRLLFKNSKRILTKRASKLNDDQKQRVNAILYISDALREAYILKELFYEVCDCTDRASAKAMMEDWIYSAQKSNLKDYHNCANTLLNWQKGILNSFEVPYTNGFTEGCNNKIKVLKRNAYGYRNFERFRKRILHMFRYKSEKAKTNAAA